MVFYDYELLYISGYILSMILFKVMNYYFNECVELNVALGISLLSWLCVILQMLYIIFTIFKITIDKYNEWFISSKGYK